MAHKRVYSFVLTNDKITVSGSSIDLLNTGTVSGYFKGDSRSSSSGNASELVELPAGMAYSLEYTSEGYEGILIDATGTVINVVIKK